MVFIGQRIVCVRGMNQNIIHGKNKFFAVFLLLISRERFVQTINLFMRKLNTFSARTFNSICTQQPPCVDIFFEYFLHSNIFMKHLEFPD